MDIILQKEVYDEFVKAFPQYIPALEDLENKLNVIKCELVNAQEKLKKIERENPSVTRKQFFENVKQVQTADFIKGYLLLDEGGQRNYWEQMRTDVYFNLRLIKKW